MRRKTSKPQTDPAVADWISNAATNKAARTNKQKLDANRVRIRLDVPERLKQLLAQAAEMQNTSTTQLGAFLLCSALIEYYSDEPWLHEWLDNSQRTSRSIRHDVDLSLESLLKTLTEVAERVTRTSDK